MTAWHQRLPIIVLATVLFAGTAGPATADPPPRPADAPERAVTLITGDKVIVRPDGKTWQVRIQPRPGHRGGFLESVTERGVTVIPAEVARLVHTGTLDRALFDVTGLLAQGLGDHQSRTLPLLVQTDGRRTATVLGQVERQLPKAGLTAVAARKGAVIDKLPAGTRRIWLNGKVKPTLDASVPQVGAPAAWQAGHTGKGTKIAILDTGYDPVHPDLAGSVVATRDFTGEGITDTYGHGTHVASIAAGRGTASAGKYTGVAKDAELLIGKVCTVDGCTFDDVMAGMQWAADNGARVVNLSLGGEPTDGTDPLAQELDRIATSSRTLFVVAAGNGGPGTKVSTPASAEQALAVGSVTKTDEQSEFSSVGPRAGNGGLKPDLTAPGSDITAARAAGTGGEEGGDEHYLAMSGTSMATPHVTGAAAIMAAQHPDWSGGRIKSVLMSSAKPLDGLSLYQQGAGRLDLARADRQQVVTDPGALQFGLLTWPHDKREPITRQLTFRNLGATAVTLGLRLDIRDQQGRPAPAGLFSAGADSVTVPAGGQASVPVTLDPKAVVSGVFGGRLISISADGSTVVQSPVGVEQEEELFTLGYHAIDRAGAPVRPGDDGSWSSAMIVDLEDGSWWAGGSSGDSLRLPRGRYALAATVWSDLPAEASEDQTVFTSPVIDLDADRMLTVDARHGVPVRYHLDRPSVLDHTSMMSLRLRLPDGSSAAINNQLARNVYAIPQEKAPESFEMVVRPQFRKHEVELTDAGGHRVDVDWLGVASQFTGTKRLRTVDVGHAGDDEIEATDVRGKLALFTLDQDELNDYLRRVERLTAKGAAATLYHVRDKFTWPPDTPPTPAVTGSGPTVQRLVADAGSTVTLTGLGPSPHFYQLATVYHGRIPARLDHRIRDRDLAAIDTTFHGEPGAIDGTITTAYLDGRRLDGGFSWVRDFRLPLRRTILRAPAPVAWDDRFGPYESSPASWKAGRFTAHWGAAALVPAPAEAAVRDEDKLSVKVALADSEGHLLPPRDVSFDGSVVLRQGGRELGRTSGPGETLAVDLPADQAEYQLSWSATSKDRPESSVDAEWTFRSGRTAGPQVLPLLTVGFRPPVRPDNTAPGNRTVRIPVEARRQPGAIGPAPLDSVEYSTDDGRTWQPAPVQAGTAIVRHPRAGWISLRAIATDADGNKAAQTLKRAYAIR